MKCDFDAILKFYVWSLCKTVMLSLPNANYYYYYYITLSVMIQMVGTTLYIIVSMIFA